MIRSMIVTCMALVVLPASAWAQEAKPKAPPKVCRSYQTSGSRIATRVCKTQAQWDEDARLNDISDGDYETRGNRVVSGRITNTGSTNVGSVPQ